MGILLTGLAGRLKEMDIQSDAGAAEHFQLAKGLGLAILAGVLSAVYGFSLAAGQPVADVAAEYGAGHFQGNVIYIFSNTGAFLTTGIYCLWLHRRHRSMREYVELPQGPERTSLRRNFAMAVMTGFLWYGQFFFYGLGHVRMGEFKFSSWGIHMIMLVLFSSVTGLALREWKRCLPRTWATLGVAVLILMAAVVSLAYGNYLGEAAASP